MTLNIKYKDFEWRPYKGKETTLYELIKWQEYNGKKSCYVIVFITYSEKESRWEINGNMDRWFNDISDDDVVSVFKITKYVMDLLNAI